MRKRPRTTIEGIIDDLIGTYVAWREECRRVDTAYLRWHAARPSERSFAFAACVAALDGEEHAAAVYRRLVERAATEAPRDELSWA